MKAAAVHWYNTFNPINNPELNPKEQLWIDRLNRIGLAYFRPLITASFLNENISVVERVSLFQAIERFVFIAFRLSRALSSYRNSEFYRAARLLRNGNWSAISIIDLLNKRIEYAFYEEEGETWFDYGYFKKYIDKHFTNGGGFYWWNGLRYFLYEYEMELVRQRGSQKIDWNLFVKNEGDKITIEHILPQAPTKPCWKGVIKELKKSEIIRMQGSLGNLLPLSRSINSSLQNDCFNDKKAPKFDENGKKIRLGYNNGSHSEIEVAQNPEWTVQEVKQRGFYLLEFMEKRWNISIGGEYEKLEMLGLEFLTKETEEQ